MVQLLCAVAEGRKPAAAAELSPAGLVSLVQAVQYMLQYEATAVQLAVQPPAALVPALLRLMRAPVLEALSRFEATARPRAPEAGLPGRHAAAPSAAAALAAGAAAALHAPFAHPPGDAAQEAALQALQAQLLGGEGATAALVARVAAAAAPGDLAAPVGLLARLVLVGGEAVMAQFVAAGGLDPALVAK